MGTLSDILSGDPLSLSLLDSVLHIQHGLVGNNHFLNVRLRQVLRPALLMHLQTDDVLPDFAILRMFKFEVMLRFLSSQRPLALAIRSR